MENIFLIPTPNESRLWRDLDSNKLTFENLSRPNSNECTKCSNEYVYITSDEKFIRDEYITDGIEVIKATPKLVDAQGLVNRRDWKKIVMTNDLELIEGGVQQIGDLFFRWFVLNPTCKEVEIGKTNKLIDNYADEEKDKWEVRYHIYDIHEKPKKNFYCGDEVDYGEQCDFQCDRCVDATGVDYGYLPNEERERGITITHKQEQKQHLIDMMESDEELGLYDEKIEDIELEEVRGSIHCQFSVVENKLAIIYRNQLKILQAIKMLNNGKRD
jgi:hypothetical protein